jgi:ribosomal protein S12 methylthiotransferase accessory factor
MARRNTKKDILVALSYIDLLNPEFGLAKSYEVGLLDGPIRLYIVAIDVGLRLESSDEISLDDRAGAVGFTLGDCYQRGVGEAVERFSCLPTDKPLPGSVIARASQLAAEKVRMVEANGTWGLPWVTDEDAPIRWYMACDLADPSATAVAIPDWWVDVPTMSVVPGWQGCPSGVAAHLSWDLAVESAVNETIERDAVMRAWADPKHGVQPVSLTAVISYLRTSSDRCHRSVAQRLSTLMTESISSQLTVFRLSRSAYKRATYLAWLTDGAVAAAGAGTGKNEPESLLKAVREAWQAYSVISRGSSKIMDEALMEDGYVARSKMRIAHWASSTGVAAFYDWKNDVPNDHDLTIEALQSFWNDSKTDGESIIARMKTMGQMALAVDLTSRLPYEVRKFGFHAVKVFIEGCQPLVVAEGESWAYLAPALRPNRPNSLYQPLI